MIFDSFLLSLEGKIGEVDILGEKHSIVTFRDSHGASPSMGLLTCGLELTCLGLDIECCRLIYFD